MREVLLTDLSDEQCEKVVGGVGAGGFPGAGAAGWNGDGSHGLFGAGQGFFPTQVATGKSNKEVYNPGP